MHPNARIAIDSLIKRERDGRYRWYVFNGYGTMVGRHPEGFPTEVEARCDAEQVRLPVAKAAIVGEVDDQAQARERNGRL